MLFIATACMLVLVNTSMAAAEKLTIENGGLKAYFNTDRLSFAVTDADIGKSYSIQQCEDIKAVDAKKTSDTSIEFTGRHEASGAPVDITFSLESKSLVIRLHADSSLALDEPIAFPGPIYSSASDFYVIPYASGIIAPVSDYYFYGYFPMWGYKSTMAFAGVTDLSSGYMIVSDDPWDTDVTVTKPSMAMYYTLQLKHHPSRKTFGYDRTIRYEFIESGGYVEMCKRYRKYAESWGYTRTLRQKAASNPNVDRLIGAADFWIGQGMWTEYFLDTIEGYGFDRVLLSLPMNWNTSLTIPDFISFATKKGYLVSRYDCLTDVYPNTYPDNPYFRTEGYPDDVIVDENGDLHKGWVTYLDDGTAFQGYTTCSKTHERYARAKLLDELAVNPYTARFLDVELAYTLTECWSPLHPESRHDDAIYRTKSMELVKEMFNIVTGSEESHDFAYSYTDYGEGTMTIFAPNGASYDWWTPTDTPGSTYSRYGMNPAARVPLHSLVYHDVHVPTWWTGDGFLKVPKRWEDKELFTALYGVMPLFMTANLYDWHTNLERFVTTYHLTSSISRRVGYEEMTGHEFLTSDRTVQKTTFSNGWNVVANFGPGTYSWEGNTLPPMGLYASSGSEKVYRIEDAVGKVAVARLEDRLFVNPYGNEREIEGVRSTGAFFLKKNDQSRLHLAFVGSMKSIDINPSKLPWPLSSITVRRADKDTAIETVALGNGWLRIDAPLGVRFFTIEGEPTGIADDTIADVNQLNVSIQASPNPFNSSATITFHLSAGGNVRLELFNILGQKIKTINDGRFEAGAHSVMIAGDDMTSGIYFARLTAGNRTALCKMSLVK